MVTVDAEGSIGFGVVRDEFQRDNLPGLARSSYGYYGYQSNGRIYGGAKTEKHGRWVTVLDVRLQMSYIMKRRQRLESRARELGLASGSKRGRTKGDEKQVPGEGSNLNPHVSEGMADDGGFENG